MKTVYENSGVASYGTLVQARFIPLVDECGVCR